MAIGKNKRLGSKGKKGGKKKVVDPFLKKEWYNLIAPSIFAVKDCGKTLVTKTQGTKIASDGLKGRVFELSLADLQQNEALSYRKIRLCVEDVQGYNCLTNFHGMDMTRDKLCSLIKKKQSIVEANVDARTTDGYLSAQIRAIRAKMVATMSELGSKGDLKSLVKELISAPIGEQIEREAAGIFPIKDCFIRKVKVLRKPRFDVTALMEWHTDDGPAADVGAAVAPAAEESGLAGSGGRL